jgi:nucleoside-diphosphate-sugar epimerase
MTTLVTGATGFLGGRLAQRLRAEGQPVRALVRPGRACGALQALGVETVPGTLEDADAVNRAAAGARTVFHCAALVSDWGRAAEFHAANVVGVRHVVEACRRAGVERLVHVSTTDVYGYPDAPVDEDAPMVARGFAYGDTKIAGECLVWAAAREQGLPVSVVRPASIYGPGSGAFVEEPAALLRAGVMFRLGGTPKPMGLAHVDNVVDALRLAASRPEAPGRAYNVHDGLPTSFDEYVDRLADELGYNRPRWQLRYRHARAAGRLCEVAWRTLRLAGRPPLTRMAADLVGTHQGFATERIRRELGFVPAVGLDEGMASIGRHAREHGLARRV